MDLATKLGIGSTLHLQVEQAWREYGEQLGLNHQSTLVLMDFMLEKSSKDSRLPPGCWLEPDSNGVRFVRGGNHSRSMLAFNPDLNILAPSLEQVRAWKAERRVLCPHGYLMPERPRSEDPVLISPHFLQPFFSQGWDWGTPARTPIAWNAFGVPETEAVFLECHHPRENIQALWWTPKGFGLELPSDLLAVEP